MPWDPDANGPVRALLIAGSTLYLGGDFTSVAGVPRGGLAAFDLTSFALTAWDPSTNGHVYALAERSGVIYAGGDFGMAGGWNRNGLAAIDVASGAVTDWDGNAGGLVRRGIARGRPSRWTWWQGRRSLLILLGERRRRIAGALPVCRKVRAGRAPRSDPSWQR
jgi:hypothetical protein